MKKITVALLALLALLLTVMPAAAQEPQTLTVFAAASLTDAFTEIAAAFEAAHPGVEVLFSFGGSSSLATQIEEGAAVDVFASANLAQMQRLRDGGFIANLPRTFARNRLVVIAPADNPAGIETLADLAQPGVLLVLAAPAVPVRDYTDAMLELLAANPDYGPAYRDAVLANLASEEDNVRQVAAKVALGEADAGIVYSSDVTPDIADKVVRIAVPDEYNTLAEYPIARVTGSADPRLGWQFIRFVRSTAGQAILAKWGFIPA